jgi:hypothetical protein
MQLVKKFPAFYGTRMFITALTSARHLYLSCAISIKFMPPHSTSWRSSLYYPPIYAWVSPVVSFPQVSPPKTCTSFSPPLTRDTCSSHLILLDYIALSILAEEYRSLSSLLCSFLHSPFSLNILLKTYFQTPLAYVSPAMSANNFHIHTKQQAKLYISSL